MPGNDAYPTHEKLRLVSSAGQHSASVLAGEGEPTLESSAMLRHESRGRLHLDAVETPVSFEDQVYLLKAFRHQGERPELYYWKSSGGPCRLKVQLLICTACTQRLVLHLPPHGTRNGRVVLEPLNQEFRPIVLGDAEEGSTMNLAKAM